MRKSSTVLRIAALAAPAAIVAALVLGCAAPTTPAFQDITTAQAAEMMADRQDDPDFVILDVRTAEEFSEGYIEGALNLDFYDTEFRSKLDVLNKDRTYLVYCRSGRRSASALDTMAELGFKEA